MLPTAPPIDRWQAVLAGRKSLPSTFGACYKLADAPPAYGLDVAFPERLDVDEKAMAITIPFADGKRRDGVGDLLEIGGIRLERHRKNPVVLFDHGKHTVWPIGMACVWDEVAGRFDPNAYTVVLDPANQTGSLKAYFYRGKGLVGVDRAGEHAHAVLCEQLFHAATVGLIRGGSIGYQVIAAKEMPPDFERGTPKGLHLLSVLMLEGSLVVMPANMDTVREKSLPNPWVEEVAAWRESVAQFVSAGKCCGKLLSPVLVKSFGGVPDRKAQMGYEGKSFPLKDAKPGDVVVIAEGPKKGTILNVRKEAWNGIYCELPDGQVISIGYNLMVDKQGTKALQPPSRGSISNPFEDVSEGDTVFARTYILFKDESQAKNQYEPFAKTGDRLKVTGIDYSGSYIKVRRNDGKEQLVFYTDLRTVPKRKGLKSLDDIRLKYRKGFKRNLKSGSPGKSVVHVRAAQANDARDYAGKLGLKVDWVGEKGGPGGTQKLRLTGDDGAIGKVAAKFGRRVKSLGTKTMNGRYELRQDGKPQYSSNDLEAMLMRAKKIEQHRGQIIEIFDNLIGKIVYPTNKSLPKQGTKAMQPTDDNTGPDLNGDGTVTAQEAEKYGGQVLRRMYQDATILLQDYDELSGPLEQEEVTALIKSRLERMVEDIEELEEIFAKLYPDSEPLSGAKDLEEDEEAEEVDQGDADTGDDNAVGVDSVDEDEEEVTPDDAVEGMERTKGLMAKYGKAAPRQPARHHGGMKVGQALNKGVCSGCGEEDCRCVKNKAANEIKPASGPYSPNSRKIESSPRPAGMRKTKLGKDLTEEEAAELGEELVEQTEDTETSFGEKALADHERSSVGEAAGFLGELTTTQDFGDEHRMKSYHYHKTMGGIASLGEAHAALENGTDVPPAEWEPGVGTKATGAVDYSKPQGRKPDPPRQTNAGTGPERMIGRKPQVGKTRLDMGKSMGGKEAGYDLFERYDGTWGISLHGQAVDRKFKTEPEAMAYIKHMIGRRKGIGGAVAGGAVGAMVGGPAGALTGAGLGSMAGDALSGKGMHPHRKACKDASDFFGELSRERAFGDAHRERAGAMAKALEEVTAMPDDLGEDGELEADMTGEAGEKKRDSAGQGWNNDKERRAAAARMTEEGDWDGGEGKGIKPGKVASKKRDSSGQGWNNDKERRAAAARMTEEGDGDGGEGKALNDAVALAKTFEKQNAQMNQLGKQVAALAAVLTPK